MKKACAYKQSFTVIFLFKFWWCFSFKSVKADKSIEILFALANISNLSMQDIAALEEIGFVSVEKSISSSGSSCSGEFNSLTCPTISWS